MLLSEKMNLIKECYYKLYGNYENYNILENSSWKCNHSDYFIMKMKRSSKYFPCDAPLKNLIEHFWDMGLKTTCSNEPRYHRYGYILFKNRRGLLKKVLWLFGESVVLRDDPFYTFKEYNDWSFNLNLNYSSDNKIYICTRCLERKLYNSDRIFVKTIIIKDIVIHFNCTMLDWIHEVLDIEKSDVTTALPGYCSCKKIMNERQSNTSPIKN